MGVVAEVSGPGNAVHFPDDDRHPRHRRLHHREQSGRPVSDRGGRLGLRSDHEPGLVDEADDGQVKGVAKVDKAPDLLGPCGGHRTGVVNRVVGEHADGAPAQPSQSGDLRRAVGGRDFEEAVAVENELQDAAHVVDAAPVARHDAQKFLFRALGVVVAGHRRRQLPDVRGEITQEAAHERARFLLVCGDAVDDTAAFVHVGSAELFLALLFSEGAFDDGGTGDHDL